MGNRAVGGAGAPGRVTIETILPIQLAAFTARRLDQTVEVRWTTASELNNEYMAVERSGNGLDFAEIGRVPGLGTTDGPAEYTFTDHSPLRGVNYYRLRQVDFDGASEVHKTVSVVFSGNAALGLTLFPNPASDQLQVRWSGEAAQNTQLRLISLDGRELARYTASAGLSSYELPTGQLTSGTYLLQIVQGKEVEQVKFVKQ